MHVPVELELSDDLVAKWTDPPSSRSSAASPQTLTHEDVLRMAGFREVDRREFPVPHAWTVDEIIGHLYSTSFASRAAFGDPLEAFEAEIRQALLAYDGSGEYSETMSFAYTFARGMDEPTTGDAERRFGGIGKSTLAEGLERRLRAHGETVDLFPEDHMFTRPDFADVAEAFRSRVSRRRSSS